MPPFRYWRANRRQSIGFDGGSPARWRRTSSATMAERIQTTDSQWGPPLFQRPLCYVIRLNDYQLLYNVIFFILLEEYR